MVTDILTAEAKYAAPLATQCEKNHTQWSLLCSAVYAGALYGASPTRGNRVGICRGSCHAPRRRKIRKYDPRGHWQRSTIAL